MNVTFGAEGFPELFAAMDKLSEEIGKGKTDSIWRKALMYAMEPVLQDARSDAPKDTNQLVEHVYMKVHRPLNRDKASKSYFGEMYMARVSLSPIRDDSRMNFVLNKRGKFQTAWTNKKPVGVSQEFGNARTPAHPFLRPALNSNSDKVISRLGTSVWDAIQTVARKKGV